MERPKVFIEGAGIVWRRQRALWLVYFVGLFLAYLGSYGLTSRVAPALEHSAQTAPRLYHAFDVSALTELAATPERPFVQTNTNYYFFPLLNALFMLFVTGGILANYERNTRLSTGEFFGACGYHFWRFFRLLLYLAIVLIPLCLLTESVDPISGRVDDAFVSPFTSVYFEIGAWAVILILAMIVRIWFDMAQVIAVAEDERRMHSALGQSARLLGRNFFSLVWLFLRIALVGGIAFGLGAYLWAIVLRPESVWKAIILGQLMVLTLIAARLWQRASETAWYGRYKAAMEASTLPAPVPAPVPAMAVLN
jgi:hypothetical protein